MDPEANSAGRVQPENVHSIAVQLTVARYERQAADIGLAMRRRLKGSRRCIGSVPTRSAWRAESSKPSSLSKARSVARMTSIPRLIARAAKTASRESRPGWLLSWSGAIDGTRPAWEGSVTTPATGLGGSLVRKDCPRLSDP